MASQKWTEMLHEMQHLHQRKWYSSWNHVFNMKPNQPNHLELLLMCFVKTSNCIFLFDLCQNSSKLFFSTFCGLFWDDFWTPASHHLSTACWNASGQISRAELWQVCQSVCPQSSGQSTLSGCLFCTRTVEGLEENGCEKKSWWKMASVVADTGMPTTKPSPL